jgi:hypothetical protein
MLTAVQGVYRRGRVELVRAPNNLREDTPVLVTFLEPGVIDLREQGINETQAADLRVRLTTFVEDWSSPEMDVYDNYDELKSLGSGTGPQTPLPHGAASCGHDAHARTQGQLLPRATISSAPAA